MGGMAEKPYLREVPLASSTLDVEREDTQRSHLVPLSLRRVALHVIEEYVDFNLATRVLLQIWSGRIRPLRELHPTRSSHFVIHLDIIVNNIWLKVRHLFVIDTYMSRENINSCKFKLNVWTKDFLTMNRRTKGTLLS